MKTFFLSYMQSPLVSKAITKKSYFINRDYFLADDMTVIFLSKIKRFGRVL